MVRITSNKSVVLVLQAFVIRLDLFGFLNDLLATWLVSAKCTWSSYSSSAIFRSYVLLSESSRCEEFVAVGLGEWLPTLLELLKVFRTVMKAFDPLDRRVSGS